MNPPFHEGKSADSGIGRDFIVSAHAALRPRGTLWMVANTHLPYEAVLSEVFFKYKEVAHASGFKVFRAEK
jgi:16S rRNA (guanine1207-N2)-methyltransferase